VRFVDGEERDLGARDELQAARGGQPLRRDVDEIERARQEIGLDAARLGHAQRGIEEGCAHAELGERRHLILHESDERRDHDPRAPPQHGRELVAQRLAAARGHQHQRVAACAHVIDDLALRPAEPRVPERPAQQVEGRIAGGHSDFRSVYFLLDPLACSTG
jgi:hypothetical protein